MFSAMIFVMGKKLTVHNTCMPDFVVINASYFIKT